MTTTRIDPIAQAAAAARRTMDAHAHSEILDDTQHFAIVRAQSLTDEALASRLTMISQNVRAFPAVERQAFLYEAAKRLAPHEDPTPEKDSTPGLICRGGTYEVVIRPHEATEPGALDGFSLSCSCGLTWTTSLGKDQAKADAYEHLEWHRRFVDR